MVRRSLDLIKKADKLRRRRLRQSARTGDAQAQFDLGCDYDFQPPKNKKEAKAALHAMN